MGSVIIFLVLMVIRMELLVVIIFVLCGYLIFFLFENVDWFSFVVKNCLGF